MLYTWEFCYWDSGIHIHWNRPMSVVFIQSLIHRLAMKLEYMCYMNAIIDLGSTFVDTLTH